MQLAATSYRFKSQPGHANHKPKVGWGEHLGLDKLAKHWPKIDQERLDKAVTGTRNFGKSLAMSWDGLGDKLTSISDKIGLKDSHQSLLDDSALTIARGVGLGVAGIESAIGVAKIIHAVKERKPSDIADGMLDLSAGAAILAVVAGASSVAIPLGALAAGLGVVRGLQLATRAFKQGASEKEPEALLESCKAGALTATILKGSAPFMGVASAILGPLAVGLQSCLGYVRVREGLKQDDKNLQVKGLAGLATAAGLAFSMCGLPAVGISLVVGAQAVKIARKLVPAVERQTDKWLQEGRTKLHNASVAIEEATDPTFQKVRHWIAEHTPWKHGNKPKDQLLAKSND